MFVKNMEMLKKKNVHKDSLSLSLFVAFVQTSINGADDLIQNHFDPILIGVINLFVLFFLLE